MPVTKSAKKALKKEIKRRKHNLFHKRRIKLSIKKFRTFLSKGEKEKAKEILPQIYKFLDKAVKEKVIKKNKASRKKSQLAKLLSE